MSDDHIDYIKLKKGNDWGANYYAEVPMKPGCGADQRNKYPILEGDLIWVRFPSGKSSQRNVFHTTSRTSVSDHGHSYPVDSHLPGIYHETEGLKIWVPLIDLEVEKR